MCQEEDGGGGQYTDQGLGERVRGGLRKKGRMRTGTRVKEGKCLPHN
jgi:hypothetical protein